MHLLFITVLNCVKIYIYLNNLVKNIFAVDVI